MKVVEQSYDPAVPVTKIRPHPDNPRRGDVEIIRESIDENGFYGACVVQTSTRRICAGEHRYRAAIAEGASTVPVLWVDVDDDTAMRILLVDNGSNDKAGYDDQRLATLLQTVDTLPHGLRGTSYNAEDLAELLARLGQDQPAGEGGEGGGDDVPDDVDPITEPGDLWILGNHRIVCGDSTTADVLALALDGRTPGAVLTDPPYGMDLDTDWSDVVGSLRSAGHGTKGGRYDKVVGDSAPFDPRPILKLLETVREQFWFGADYYAERLPGKNDGSWLVWDKRLETQAEAIGSEFELIWSRNKHKRRMLRHDWFGFLSSENPDEARGRVHPTQKPTSLLRDILTQWVAPAALVVDPFLGAGSTLIACEQTGRPCAGVEILPRYVDVAVRRWETLTGDTGELIREGL